MELLPLVCLCLLSCSGDAVRVVVEQDSDAVLPCLISTKEDISGELLVWKKDGQKEKKEVFLYDAGVHYNNGLPGQDDQFKGRVSFFQDQLENGDASIKITRTKMADSGTYSCDFPRHQSRQTSIIELVVEQVLKDRTGENIPGAAPEPVIKILAETKDWSLLQCEAHGDPLPTVEWKDSDDNTLPADTPQISERGGRSYITVSVTVTKTDNYCCVATQEKFSHQVAAVTSVHIGGAASEPYVTAIKTDDGIVLRCGVLGVSPKPKVEWRDSSGNILPVKEVKETEKGGLYYIILRADVTKTDTFSCVVTQEEIGHEVEAEIYVVKGSSAGLFIGGVVCGLLVAAVVAVAAVVYHFKDRIRQICALYPGSRRNTANGPPGADSNLAMLESRSELHCVSDGAELK